MALKHDDFPASAAFDVIADALKADDAGRKKAIQDSQAYFVFKLKNTASKEETWHIDMKENGTVGKGGAPEGKKPVVTLSMSDENFQKLIDGKTKAQNLYMSGKLKVGGNIMKATKLEPILSKVGGQSKL